MVLGGVECARGCWEEWRSVRGCWEECEGV